MVTVGRLCLLGAGVTGAVVRPWRLPRSAVPLLCAVVVVLAGLLSFAGAREAVGAMGGAVGFLLAAIPLAVLLDSTGYFEQVAELVGAGRFLVPGLWVLGAVSVAVLNLDAAVVLLTPLYVRVAARRGRSERFLGFQPVLLALLASSLLPVSNLTNLIVAARLGVRTGAFVEHLGAPVVVACVVGYFCYRRCEVVCGGAAREVMIAAPVVAVASEPPAPNRAVLIGGSAVVLAVLVGFSVGPLVGVAAWEVALAADVVLLAVTRHARAPLTAVPWDTAVVAVTLAVLATAATTGLHLGGLLAGSETGPLAALRQFGLAAGGANVVNNLPALLVALPSVTAGHGAAAHATCALWPVLYGVNAGPSLLVTGSLASLLWLDGMKRMGAPVSAGRYFAVGWRVVVPAALAGLAALVVVAPLVGC